METHLGSQENDEAFPLQRNPALQTFIPDKTSIAYVAEFDFYTLACCASPWLCLNSDANRCCLDNTRLYFYVLENGYEYSTPIPVFDTFFTLMIQDYIYRYYFDRGVYNRTSCWWKLKCMKGKPKAFPGEVQNIFLGEECTSDWNSCRNCYWPKTCGERVRIVPADVICCCIPNRSNRFYNFCGLCGPKDGEPICLTELVSSLKSGTAEHLARKLETARSLWADQVLSE